MRDRYTAIAPYGPPLALLALLAGALLALLPARPGGAQSNDQFFPETGHTVSGAFLDTWRRGGGLPIFGYPISDVRTQQDPATGRELQVQWFERARFELHPELPAGSQVLLGRLGSEVTQGREGEPPFQPVGAPADPGIEYFPQTGHTLGRGFLSFWRQNGGLPIFGYPISEEFQEVSPTDGRTYTVQYFERARFEYHPELPPGSQVLLGLLGTQLLGEQDRLRIEIAAAPDPIAIEPGQTALVPRDTKGLTVSLRFPQPVDPGALQVQLRQLSGPPPWQLAPAGPQPGRNVFQFGLAGAAGSPDYLQVQVTRGPDQPPIVFGVQVASGLSGPPLVANWSDPVALVNSYYNAINRREYQRAYSYWEQPGRPGAVPASYQEFAAGYRDTASVAITTGTVTSDAGAGSVYYGVPVVIAATQSDGSVQRFYGCYAVHRVNVPVGDSAPPYPLQLSTANVAQAAADADPGALLAQANALAEARQCGQ